MTEPGEEDVLYTLQIGSLNQEISFYIPKDQQPPQKIRLFDGATSNTFTVFYFEKKRNTYIELTKDELERFDHGFKTGQCRHSDAVNRESVNRESGDERLAKRLAKLQRKLRDKKNNQHRCSYCDEYGGVFDIEMQISETKDNTEHDAQTKPDDLKLSEPEVVVLGSSSIRISWSESVANNEHLAECAFELQMSKSKNSSFSNIFSGYESTFTQIDLLPGTKYYFRLRAVKELIKGPFSPEVCTATDAAAPCTPDVPHLSNKTKTSLLLKWTTKSDNGSPITAYILQWDGGNTSGSFQTIYEGLQKQYKFNHKLPPMTSCRFRVKAVNKIGESEISADLHCTTNAGVPSTPEPPVLIKATANSIQLSWEKSNCNGAEITEYSLEMDNEDKGHGFLVVYRDNGHQCTVKDNLKRNTAYKFRLCAINAQGSSKWSDVITHSTISEAPGRMLPPVLDGKIHAKSFAVLWAPPTDDGGSEIVSYSLEINDGKADPFHKAYTGLDMNYKFQNLLPGHVYKVRVSCATSRLQSPWSDVAMIKTLPVIPVPPSEPRESKNRKPQLHTIELDWDPPNYNGGANITNYNVQMRKSDDEDFRHIYLGPKSSCCASGLLPDCEYSFRVRAQNSAGDSKFSEISHISTGPGTPDAVSELELLCRSSNVLKILWKVPKHNGTPVTGYNLEWGENTEGPFEKLYSGVHNNYDVKKGVLPSTEYYFRVQASSIVGNSPWSEVASCKTPAAPPAQVSHLKVVGQTSTSLTLEWHKPNNSGAAITLYNIDIIGHEIKSYVIDDCEVMEDVDENHLGLLRCTLLDLLPHTQYKFRVQGVNKSGCGAFSSVIYATTGSLPPNAPSLEMTSSSYQSIKLHWTFLDTQSKANELKFDLQLRYGDERSFETVYEGSGTSHKVGKLKEQTSYSFRIRAVNEAGYGPYSDIFICQTTVQPPPSVKGFNYSELSKNKVTLSWKNVSPVHPSDCINYIIQWQRKAASELQKIYEGNQTYFTCNNLTSDQTYSFRVCAVRILVDGRKIQSAFTPLLSLAVSSEIEESVSNSTLKLDENDEKPEKPQLTEKQLALIFFVGFAAIVLFMSLLISLIVG